MPDAEETPPTSCNHWRGWMKNESFPIWYDADMNEWHLIHASDRWYGHMIVRFCPSCGAPMPPSIREKHFATPAPEEAAAAQAVAAKATTLAALRDLLDEPDSSLGDGTPLGDPASTEWMPTCQLIYRHPWKTVDLVAQEGPDGKVRYFFPARYIGKPAP